MPSISFLQAALNGAAFFCRIPAENSGGWEKIYCKQLKISEIVFWEFAFSAVCIPPGFCFCAGRFAFGLVFVPQNAAKFRFSSVGIWI